MPSFTGLQTVYGCVVKTVLKRAEDEAEVRLAGVSFTRVTKRSESSLKEVRFKTSMGRRVVEFR